MIFIYSQLFSIFWVSKVFAMNEEIILFQLYAKAVLKLRKTSLNHFPFNKDLL